MIELPKKIRFVFDVFGRDVVSDRTLADQFRVKAFHRSCRRGMLPPASDFIDPGEAALPDERLGIDIVE
jgi:hypothetical protein